MYSYMQLMISLFNFSGLIDNHKKMHGDTPFTRVRPLEGQRSSRDHSTIVGHSYSSSGRRYPPETRGGWKRKYSLRHKSPQSSATHPFSTTSSCNGRVEASVKTATGSSGSALQSPKHVAHMTTGTIATYASKKTESFVAQRGQRKAESSSTLVPHETHHITFHRTQQMPGGRCVLPPENTTIPNTSHSLPSQVSETGGKSTITTAVPAATTTITPSVATLPNLAKQPSRNLSTPGNRRQATRAVSTNSKFVWVKTQNVEVPELQKSSSVSHFPPSNSGAESSVCKKTPDKKPPRRLTQASTSPKSFKYKWVSSAAQSKMSRKALLLKLPLPQRALETGDSPNKVKTPLTSPTRNKKEVATSSRSSRYSWDAVTAGGTAVPRRSSFHWTSEKHRVREGFSSGTLSTSLPCTSSLPGAFKLHSRMKIIHRSAQRSVNISSKTSLKLKVELSL